MCQLGENCCNKLSVAFLAKWICRSFLCNFISVVAEGVSYKNLGLSSRCKWLEATLEREMH